MDLWSGQHSPEYEVFIDFQKTNDKPLQNHNLATETDRISGRETSETMAYKALDHITVSDIEAVGIPPEEAEKLHIHLSQILRNHGAATPETWKNISKSLLNPNLPFPLHQMMYYGCYKDTNLDTPPAWIPDP